MLTDTITCGDVSGVQITPHTTPDAIGRRIPRLIVRSIVGDHDWWYGRSFMATTSRTIFSNRCWSCDHAYYESCDDQPPAKKTNCSMRPLLEIVANIADRSHVRQIATNRTIKKSYDPVWLWLKMNEEIEGTFCKQEKQIYGWNWRKY